MEEGRGVEEGGRWKREDEVGRRGEGDGRGRRWRREEMEEGVGGEGETGCITVCS